MPTSPLRKRLTGVLVVCKHITGPNREVKASNKKQNCILKISPKELWLCPSQMLGISHNLSNFKRPINNTIAAVIMVQMYTLFLCIFSQVLTKPQLTERQGIPMCIFTRSFQHRENLHPSTFFMCLLLCSTSPTRDSSSNLSQLSSCHSAGLSRRVDCSRERMLGKN